MKRKQMISFLLASSISITPLSIIAEPITSDMPSLIKNEGDIETTTSPAIEIVPDNTVIEDKPTVLPLLPEDYEEEANRPVTLPMTPEDYEEEASRPVVLPMTPQDYEEIEEMESQKGVYMIDSQGYTVVEYNDKNDSLEAVIQRLGIPFPEKLKVVNRGNGEIDWSDSWYLKENGVDVDLTEINFWKNEIMRSAFENSPTLRSIKLPNTVTRIEDYAFRNCRNLSGELILPNGIDTIGEQVFANTNISGNLIIPDSITSIGEGAFANCPNLNGYLILPARKSMSIDMPAIQGNNFHTIINYSTRNEGNQIAPSDIRSNQTYYGFSSNETFKQTVLENGGNWVELADDRLWEDIYIRYDSRYNSLKEAIEANVPYIETYHLRDWVQKNLIIETADGKMLTAADFDYLNQSYYLMSLDLTNADCENREIPQNAFNHNARLIHCKLPRNIDVIQSNAFFNCQEMIGRLEIPETVTSIKSFAFTECGGLTGNLNLPKGLVEIGDSAFSGCDGLTGEIILPKGLKTIGFSAFQHCTGFTGDLFLPDSLTQINNFAFGGCTGLNGTLTLPAKKILYSSDAFNYTQFETIRNYSAQPLRNVISFNEVDTQNFYGFSDNVLQKQEIDLSQVNWIELSEPSQWENLEIIYDNRYNSLEEAIEDQVPLIEKYNVRDWVQKNVVIITEDGKTLNEMDFKTLNESSYLMRLDLSQAQCESNIIPEKAFEENKILIYLTLPNEITHISDFAFAYMSEWIGHLTLPSSLTSIGQYAFTGNEGLKTLILPSKLQTIGNYAFLNLLGLNKIVNNYEGNQTLGESALDVNSQEGLAYGYIENTAFKTEIEKEGFTWKEIGLRATPIHQEIRDGEIINLDDLYEAYFDGERLYGIGTTESDLSHLSIGLNEIEVTLNYEGMIKTIIVEVTVLPNESTLEIEPIPKVITHGDVLDLEDLFILRYNGEEVVPDTMNQTTDYPLESLPIGNFQIGITVTYKNIEKSVITDVTVNVDEKNFIVEPLHQTIAHGNPITVEQLYQATYRTLPVTNAGHTEMDLNRLDIGKHEIPIAVRHLGMERNIVTEVTVMRNFNLYEVTPIGPQTIKQGESIDLNDLFTATYNGQPIEVDQVRQVSNLDLNALPIGEHEVEIEVTYKELKKNVKVKVTVKGDETLFIVNPLNKEIIDGDNLTIEDLYEAFYQDLPVEADATTSVNLNSLPLGVTEVPLNVTYKGMTKEVIAEVTVKPHPEQLKVQSVSKSIQHGESLTEDDLYLLTYKEMPVRADEVIQTTNFDLARLPIGSHEIGLNIHYKGSVLPIVSEVEVLANENLFEVIPLTKTITEGEIFSLEDLYQATYNEEIIEAMAETEIDLTQLSVGEHEVLINVSYEGLNKNVTSTVIVNPNHDKFILENRNITILDGESISLNDLFEAKYNDITLDYEELTSINQLTDFNLDELPLGTHEIEIEVEYKNARKVVISRVTVNPSSNAFHVTPQEIEITHGEEVDIENLYQAIYNEQIITNIGSTEMNLTNLNVGNHEIEVTVRYFNLEETVTARVIVIPNENYFEVNGIDKEIVHGDEINLHDLYEATYNQEKVIADEVYLINPTDISSLSVGEHSVDLNVIYKDMIRTITSTINVLPDEENFIVQPIHPVITDGDFITVEDLYDATYKDEVIEGIGKVNVDLDNLELGENNVTVTVEHLGMEQSFEVTIVKNPNPDYFQVKAVPQFIEHGESILIDNLYVATYKEEPIIADQVIQTTSFDLSNLEVGNYLVELNVIYKEMIKSVEIPIEVLARESDFIVKPIHPVITDGNSITVEDLYDAIYKDEVVEGIGKVDIDLDNLELGENKVTVTVEHLGMEQSFEVTIIKNPNPDYFVVNNVSLSIVHGENILIEDLYAATYKEEPIIADQAIQTTQFELNNLPVGEHQISINVSYKGMTKQVTSTVNVNPDIDHFEVEPVTKDIVHGTSLTVEDLYHATYKGEKVIGIGQTEIDLSRLEVGIHQIPIAITHLGMEKQIEATVNVAYNEEYFNVSPTTQNITHGESIIVDKLYTATYDNKPIVTVGEPNKDLNNLPVGTHEIEITVTYEGMTKQVTSTVIVNPDIENFIVEPVTQNIVHGTSLTIEDLYTATYKGEKVTNVGHTEVDLSRLEVGTHIIPITITHLGMEREIEATVNVSYNEEYFNLEAQPQTITHGESVVIDSLYTATYDNQPIVTVGEPNKDLNNLPVGENQIEITVTYEGITKKVTSTVIVNPDIENFTVEPVTKNIIHGTSLTVEDLYSAIYKGEKVTDIGQTEVDLSRLGVGTHVIPITVTHLGMEKEVEVTVNVSHNEEFFNVSAITQTITYGESITVEQLYNATYDEKNVKAIGVSNEDLTKLPVGENQIEITVTYEGMVKTVVSKVNVFVDEESLIVKPTNPTITDDAEITVEDLYDVTYKDEVIENIGKIDVDLSDLELGENNVTVTVDFEGVKQEIEVTITVNPNMDYLKAEGISQTIIQGQPVKIEDLYQATYKDQPIQVDQALQTTMFDLNRLPVGKHQVGIQLSWKGLNLNLISEVTVKQKPIIEEENHKIPATPLEPAQTIIPMEKLESAIVHKPLTSLTPAISNVPIVEEIEKPQEDELKPILPSEQQNTPVENPDLSGDSENTVNDNSSKNNNTSHVTNKGEQNSQSHSQGDENLLLETDTQEWVEIEPSIPIQTIEDTQLDEVEISQQPLSEEIIVNDDSEQATNSFYEYVKKLFPNMSYETFILLSSSTVFIVMALILVIVVYINKKRKEKDNE